MTNFEVRYAFDGGIWYAVIAARSEGQAIDYLIYNESAREIIGIKKTNKEPDTVVPDGWVRPEPALPTEEEIELFRLYNDWAWDRCKELDLDPEYCDVDFDTWLREVHSSNEERDLI